MTTERQDDSTKLATAQLLADRHGYRIVPVQDRVKGFPVTAYVVYKNAVNGSPSQRLFKRRDVGALLRAMRKMTGTP